MRLDRLHSKHWKWFVSFILTTLMCVRVQVLDESSAAAQTLLMTFRRAIEKKVVGDCKKKDDTNTVQWSECNQASDDSL
jgi:hypothetical protein